MLPTCHNICNITFLYVFFSFHIFFFQFDDNAMLNCINADRNIPPDQLLLAQHLVPAGGDEEEEFETFQTEFNVHSSKCINQFQDGELSDVQIEEYPDHSRCVVAAGDSLNTNEGCTIFISILCCISSRSLDNRVLSGGCLQFLKRCGIRIKVIGFVIIGGITFLSQIVDPYVFFVSTSLIVLHFYYVAFMVHSKVC